MGFGIDAAVLICATSLTLTAALAAGADITLVLGGSGWTLEHFGSEATILRANLTREAGNAAGSVVLSCAEGQRRLTIGLTSLAIGRDGDASTGALLVSTVPHRPGDPFLIARRQPRQAGTFAVVEVAGLGGAPVLDFARLMLGQRRRIDLLLREGRGPVALGSLTPLQVSLSWSPRDAVAFHAFLAACTIGSPRH